MALRAHCFQRSAQLGFASTCLNASRASFALHVGICAVNGLAYLLTWNFRHLANAQMQDTIREACEAQGYGAPIICSPDALFEPPERQS